MIVIGVTGSFGTGKSTVAKAFKSYGAMVLDADRLAHQLMVPGSPVFKKLTRRFGQKILKGSKIDRKALANAGFASKRAWADLCRIVHPAVIQEIKRRIRKCKRNHCCGTIVLDVPLLIESKMHRMVDGVVVVACTRANQMKRLRGSRWSPKAINKRLRWQLPLSKKLRYADVVIDNNGSVRATRAQVQQLWKQIGKTGSFV